MPKIFKDDFLTRMGPSVPKIFRDDFFTRMGRSVPKIFRDDFLTRMGPSVPKIFRDDFFTRMGPSVPKIFRDDFFTRIGPSVPERLRGDVSPKWDNLCPKRKILHRGNSWCAWRDYFASLLFSRVSSTVCFSLYIFSFELFFFACLSVFTQVGRSVPKIFRDDFSREWDHLCPRYLGVIFYPSRSI